jgi:hypothetical protein
MRVSWIPLFTSLGLMLASQACTGHPMPPIATPPEPTITTTALISPAIPTAASPLATTVPGRPVPGIWKGDFISFTVSADGSQVCNFTLNMPIPEGACGYQVVQDETCHKIDRRVTGVIKTSADYTFQYTITLTTATMAEGTYNVIKDKCSTEGGWRASPP